MLTLLSFFIVARAEFMISVFRSSKLGTDFHSPLSNDSKISTATTDSGKDIVYSEKKKGISNLLTIYSLFADKSIKDLEKEFSNSSYKEFKESLANVLIEKLKPFRENKANKKLLQKTLGKGAKDARKIAEQTMKEVRKNMGL